MQIAKRTLQLKPSATLAISAKAKALKAAGEPIINLSAGEPDFNTPDFICEAAIKAIKDGKHRYTAADGTPELKQAIIDKFATQNNLSYTTEQVIASTGAKQALFNAFMALLNPGDEVIIPAPYWVSYPAMTQLAEAIPITIPTTLASHYKITAEQLEATITKKSRLLILNSPSNPSGQAYSHSELKALAEVLLKHPNIAIICDDIYEHIYWGKEPFANLVMICPELMDRTIVLNGVSKAYAMTGWRLGYAAGPKDILAVMKKIQSQSTSNPCSITQEAALAALTGDQSCVIKMVNEFKQRHDYITKALASIPGFELGSCDGAFYVLPHTQALIDQLPNVSDDIELADHLLTEAKVATVPGTAFDQPGYLRLSYALDQPSLEEAVTRIKTLVIAK